MFLCIRNHSDFSIACILRIPPHSADKSKHIALRVWACVQTGRQLGFLYVSDLITSICIGVRCSRPRRPVRGSVRFDSRKYGSTLSYHCNTGLVLSGARAAVCNPDGQWSRQPPTCRRMCVAVVLVTPCIAVYC